MNLHLDTRPDGTFAFYMDGDLQFDSADEAVYHESLVLPALSLLPPAPIRRVLICGGGDGLAMREALRFPGVTHVDLVDYCPEVVELGRTTFADLNANAFTDARAHVHIADAWEFLAHSEPYDAIFCDFTVPRRPEDTRVFTQEWYARVRQALSPTGIAAFNTVSAQTTPEAFWCVRKTVRAAELHALPYRVCIPSFRAHGYGAWGFLLASHAQIHLEALKSLRCPVETKQADLRNLWRGAHFSRAERELEKQVPVHSLTNNCLLHLELNPGMAVNAAENSAAAYDPEPLTRLIPILHPSHTRTMIETLAEQVMGTITALDLRRLTDALLQRAKELPGDILVELTRLRTYLTERLPGYELFGAWSRKIFVTLVILMTLANAIAPDNAFAKGSFGIGHASMSRGSSSFGGARGISEGGRSSSSSFGGTRGTTGGTSGRANSSFGGSPGFGSSFSRSGTFKPAPAITHSGFRRTYATGRPTDMYGYSYEPRTYVYFHSYGGYGYGYGGYGHGNSGNGGASNKPGESHQAFFVADDDMLVMENGDIIVTLSDEAFLLVNGGSVSLYSKKNPNALLALYPDSVFFQNVQAQLQDQQAQVQYEIATRRDWLSWVGWTSALSATVKDDKLEVQNLQDLDRRLTSALSNLKMPSADTPPAVVPGAGSVELFVDAVLMPSGRIGLRLPNNHWQYTDGKHLWAEKDAPDSAGQPCPPELNSVLKSVLTKLTKEFEADIKENDSDLSTLKSERADLDKDLAEYQNLQDTQPGEDVDYGTEEISASDAISRTQNDITQNTTDTAAVQADRDKTEADLAKVRAASERMGP